MRIWGKLDLYPADIDTATVGCIRINEWSNSRGYCKICKEILEIPIEYPALTGTIGDG